MFWATHETYYYMTAGNSIKITAESLSSENIPFVSSYRAVE